MKNETDVVPARITLRLAELIEEFCGRDAYLNLADFIRDAIRDRLQREALELYTRFFPWLSVDR